jgi:hypothetical protein
LPGTSTNLRKISVSTPATNTTTKPVLPPLATQQVAHVPIPSSHLDPHSSTPTAAATTPTAPSTTATAATPPGGSKTENVTVTVRIRPFSSSELKVAGGPTEVWTVGDAGSSIAYTDDYAVQARRVAVDYNYGKLNDKCDHGHEKEMEIYDDALCC